MKYLLDTDHISILQRQAGVEYGTLLMRVAQHPPTELACSIISFHEQVLGCHTYISQARRADDATLTVQTDRVTFNGVEEIHRLFADFMGARDSIIHEITNIVVEPDAKKVATEQRVVLTGSTQGGDDADMHNCNFFNFNDEGKFSRVIIWMDGTNPFQ